MPGRVTEGAGAATRNPRDKRSESSATHRLLPLSTHHQPGREAHTGRSHLNPGGGYNIRPSINRSERAGCLSGNGRPVYGVK